jgi:hypothetical protein
VINAVKENIFLLFYKGKILLLFINFFGIPKYYYFSAKTVPHRDSPYLYFGLFHKVFDSVNKLIKEISTQI